MRVIVFDGLEKESRMANALKDMIRKRSKDFSDFKLKEMNIVPCRSCGACGFKTPGKCIFDDDMPKILKAFAPSSMVVFITPIRFGGYSSQLKKAVDRLMIIGEPLYEVKKGHLLHPMRYGDKAFVGIGFIEDKLQGQEEAFKALVDNNALNMQFSYNKALIFTESDSFANIESKLSKVFEEVSIG